MTHVFHRNPKTTLKIAAGGHGIELVDQQGKRYIDASGGAAVCCLGHGHPVVIDAIKRQLDTLAYVHSSFMTTRAAEDLADLLAAAAPGDLNHVYYVSGGSEAIEASLKLARQYFMEIGQPQRRHIIARRQSYHGNTLGALAIGGNALRRAPFLPLLIEAHHVSPCYAYRHQRADETEDSYAARLADELEQTILELGADTVAAFVAETVVGATAGAVPPVKGYFRRVRDVCDRHGVLLILDEVMSGMGRTGYRFAYEQEGIVPDIVAIAKGLGAGYQPIGAMIASDRIYDAIVGGSGFFQHGHTYMGHATACAAALAVQHVIDQDRLLDNVRERGEQLRAELREALGSHPLVGDIRGRGLFVGVEFVRDKETREPLPPALKAHARIKAGAMRNGLMVYPSGGTIDGKQGDHALIAPPFICTAGDIGEIVARFAKTVKEELPSSLASEPAPAAT
jgi:adenosylmethionine-8-amino-7-oxononanoate aminotransferase